MAYWGSSRLGGRFYGRSELGSWTRDEEEDKGYNSNQNSECLGYLRKAEECSGEAIIQKR